MKKENQINIVQPDFFFQFVRDCFQQKRKNLRNNLKSYDLKLLEEILKECGYCLQDRAEKISLESFVKIANEYVRKKEIQ